MKCFLHLLGLSLLVWSTYSCKSIETPTLPEMPAVPGTFLGSSDTLSIGDIQWEAFFDDPHLTVLIEEALANNLDLLAAMERIEIARTQFQIGKRNLFPTVDGIVRYRSGDIKSNLLNGTINGDRNVANRVETNFMGFQSTWEIDLWGKLKDRKNAAYYRLLASEKGRQLITTGLVAEVARLYYDLLGFDMELETIEKNIEYQEMALELIKIQKMAGRATELAVQQFSAQLLSTQSLRYQKLQEIIETENALDFLMGRYPKPIERAESLSDIRLPEVVNTGVPSDLLLRRPDIQQAEMELLASKLDLKAARAEFFPSLSLTPYMGLNSHSIPSALQLPGSLTLGILGGITTPIFQQGRIRAGFDRAIAENNISMYNYQQAILGGFREVVTTLQRVQNLKKMYALKEEETQVLLNAVNTSNDLFRGGYASYLEVITAQAKALDAELEMTNTRKEVFQSVIDLYRSLGGGWN